MENIIEIKKLKYNFDDNVVFDGLDLTIKQGEWVTIVGSNGSGKSTLVKLLVGLLKGQNYIKIDNLILNYKTLFKIRKKIGFLFQNPDNQFIGETVIDDIAFSLENLGLSPKTIKSRIKKVSSILKIDDLLDKEPHHLSGGEKQKVALAGALVINPKILILDEALMMIDYNFKKEILEILKDLNKKENITIIMITHDLEDSLYGDRLLILEKGKIIKDGFVLDVFKDEEVINKTGLNLPFMVDLSLKLQFYDLIDKIILDSDEMVAELWK